MKGILFKPDMVKAMEVRKTQTRRLISPQPEGKPLWHRDHWVSPPMIIRHTPHYLPNETVYVKEAWRLVHWIRNPLLGSEVRPDQYNGLRISIGYGDNTTKIFYVPEWPKGWDKNHRLRNGDGSLQSPMFLKEIFARTFLTILSVEPQRLQEITEEDAVAEGINDNDCLKPSNVNLDNWKYTFQVVKK